MLDKSDLEINSSSTLEDGTWHDLLKGLKDIEPIWKQEMKSAEDALVEEITRLEPEWVKSSRVNYLWDQAHQLLEEAYGFMDLIFEEEMPKWLRELLLETEINPRLKKVYSCMFQVKMWETKEFIEDTNMVYDTDAIRARHSIVDVIERYGVKLRKTGTGRWVGLCPWHNEKSSSFMVYEKGDAHCYGCGANCRDVIEFVMKMEKCDFRRACKILS